MLLQSLEVRQFRCFEHFACSFSNLITLFEGPNGTGKTALLEALAYACYLRSFRTSAPRELVHWGGEGFVIRLEGTEGEGAGGEPWDLKILVSGNKRIVKLNSGTVTSFRELFASYRSITVIGDDISMITGFPEQRRLFLDQALVLACPAYAESLRTYRSILRQRNALLAHPGIDKTSYDIWTERLQEATTRIRTERIAYLAILEQATQALVELIGVCHPITLTYKETPWKDDLWEKERIYRRSLAGAHLDDICISWAARQSKLYASRGQQKLIVLLMKIAQLSNLEKQAVLLIDDFATDFDTTVLTALINLIGRKKIQTLITAPSGNPLRKLIEHTPHSLVTLT